MSFEKNIAIIPPYEDIFGQKPKSLETIATEISEFSTYAIIHVCSKLMLLLNSTDGTSTKVQGSVAGELLSDAGKEKLLNFIAAHDDSRLQFFHHVPVLMLLKINLERNTNEGKDIETQADKTLLASWILSLSDTWVANVRAHKRGWKYFYENLRINQSKQYLQESHDEVINLLARGNYLLEKVIQVKGLEFSKLFKRATGISVELYTEMLFLVMVQWSVRLEGAVIDKIAVRKVTNFFSTSDFTKAEIEYFMKIISFSVEDYARLKSDAMGRIKIKDDPQNFIVFIDRPILTYGDYFICLSPSFLALKLTEGPYRIVEAALKGKKNENQLSDEWGKAYEAYVNERLGNTSKDTRPNLKSKNSELDNLVISGKYALMVESKFVHWTYAARITGSKDDMKKYLGKIARFKDWKPKPGGPLLRKKLGLGQIKQFYSDVSSDLETYALENKIVIPTLVLGEGFPFDPGNRKYLEDYAMEERCLIKNPSVAPFITVTSDELELIESFSEEFGQDYVINLIGQYAQSLDTVTTRKTPVHLRPTSLFNHFHATGKKSKNNKFLRKELDNLSNRVMKHRTAKARS